MFDGPISPVPSHPAKTSAGLVAEEVSALRKLAQDRRAASFVRFCKTPRPAQTREHRGERNGTAEPAAAGPLLQR
jgi:hypothetical protein